MSALTTAMNKLQEINHGPMGAYFHLSTDRSYEYQAPSIMNTYDVLVKIDEQDVPSNR